MFLDPDATVAELTRSVEAAGAAGAQLVVFPEAILPGYPDWVWPLPAWIPMSTFDGDRDSCLRTGLRFSV